MEEKRESERCIAQILPQYSAVLVQPLAAEEKVFWCLFDATATKSTVCFANPEEVCLVVSMANLELVEGTGNFSSCSHGNTELLSGLPAILGSIGIGIALDGLWCRLGKHLSPFLGCNLLDLDASHSQTGNVREGWFFGSMFGKAVCPFISSYILMAWYLVERDGSAFLDDLVGSSDAAKLPGLCWLV